LVGDVVAIADGKRPNVVVILADDFGVGDIQAHYPENKIRTPHLDRLAREGMSFTDAHSGSAVCSPTRYGLLTGRYAWRTRLQEWVLASYEPPLIDASRLTLPGFLKQQGYHTACIGKWHLGFEWPGPQPSRRDNTTHALATAEWDFTQPIRGGPTERGFDEYFGVDLPNFPPFTFIENDRVTPLPTDRYKFDDDAQLVMLRLFDGAPMALGWRFDNILPEITKQAVAYIHRRAKEEEPFFLYFALTSPHSPIVPSKKFAGKSGIAPIADFVMETDWSVGQVLRAIEEAKIADETIVIFAADNGHAGTAGWQELVDAGHKPSGPYRGRKGDIWEGGHRVPFIVRWPGRVAAGSTSRQLVCLNDLFATCAHILGKALPYEAAEDSFSFLPALIGKRPQRDVVETRGSVVHHSVYGEFAYRKGEWKLVFRMSSADREASRRQPTVAELYNLKDDIAERNNLADEQAGLVTSLTQELQTLVERGVSRAASAGHNDRVVQFDVLPAERWAVEAD